MAWDPITPPGQLPRALGPPEPAVDEAAAPVVFAREPLIWVTCPGLDGRFSHLLPASQQERDSQACGSQHPARWLSLPLSKGGIELVLHLFLGFYFLKTDSQRHDGVLMRTRLRRRCEHRWGAPPAGLSALPLRGGLRNTPAPSPFKLLLLRTRAAR